MARRRASGLTHKEIGDEFGFTGQHAGRLLRQNFEPDDSYKEDNT